MTITSRNAKNPPIETEAYAGDTRNYIKYCGTKDRLIRAGLATPQMFPSGTTPTGRVRTEKRSPKSSLIRWSVYKSQGDDRWEIWYHNMLSTDPAEIEGIKEGQDAALRFNVRAFIDKSGGDRFLDKFLSGDDEEEDAEGTDW